MKTVNVLLSTYNGEKYIVEQLESILKQNNVNVKIFARDDGSNDKTIEILRSYKNKGKLEFIQGKNVGPARSFIQLLAVVPSADFYAFADQDDVWEPDKLWRAVNKLENISGPALYYSNLKVVDKNLNFFRNSHNENKFDGNKYHSLLINNATGCTEVFNEKLREIVINRDIEYLNMHDWWIYIVCCFFGTVVYDAVPHILYRQHESNVVGTYLEKNFISIFRKKCMRLFDRSKQPRYLTARCFLRVYDKELLREDKKEIEKLVNYRYGFVNKIKFIFDKKLKTKSKARNIALIVLSIFDLL